MNAIAEQRWTSEVLLIRQWLQACLPLHAYLSLPVQSEVPGSDFAKFVQVLALETKNVLVASHEEPKQGLYMATVQPLERWAPISQDPALVRRGGGMLRVRKPLPHRHFGYLWR